MEAQDLSARAGPPHLLPHPGQLCHLRHLGGPAITCIGFLAFLFQTDRASMRTSGTMFPTRQLLLQACRITFFTRQNCSLCTNAKNTLADVYGKRRFEYQEIDVMSAGQGKWKDVYEFDTPVVCSPPCFFHFRGRQGMFLIREGRFISNERQSHRMRRPHTPTS